MIYIFYLDCIPSNKKGNMHGGNAYSKRIMNLFLKNDIEISVLLPKGYKTVDAEEKNIFLNKNVQIIERPELNEAIKLEPNSILFFPLLSGRNLYLLKNFKEKNPTVKIYITIHGLRLLDLIPDRYDRYYYNGLKYCLYNLYAPVLYWVRCFLYKKVLQNTIPKADKIFTVSNYSLKQIVDNSKPKYIMPYYCGINLPLQEVNDTLSGNNYFLFVSAGRSEKNFLRTLEAFVEFKKRYQDERYYLYVTGLNQVLEKRLKRYPKWDEAFIDRWVKIFDYVDGKELSNLYRNSYAVLYTSKSEGFGLPALEACLHGTALVAAYGSAIPEVLESAPYYINPYSVDSICEGLHYISCKENQEFIKQRLRTYQNVITMRIEKSDSNFIKEFIR